MQRKKSRLIIIAVLIIVVISTGLRGGIMKQVPQVICCLIDFLQSLGNLKGNTNF